MHREPTEEEIAEINERENEKVAQDFKVFREAVKAGNCPICHEALISFNEGKPCMHWLLRPNGFRKKHFKKIFDEFTYDRIESFLRWYVNVHEPFKNINDLKEEHDPNKIKALTISHDKLEWSFSFSEGCLEGKDGPHGPHYHFQMKVDGLPFHSYSDRHIKLSDYELWVLDVERGKDPQFKMRGMYGMGMQGTVEDLAPEDLLAAMRTTDDEENAAFHVSTLVEADEGHTISGDAIADMYDESKRTGVPMHQLVKRLQHVKTQVYIEPGPGVPIAAQRTPLKRGKNKRQVKKDD